MTHSPLERVVMCHSDLIPRNVERSVKDPKDVDVPVVFHNIGDSVVPVEENAHVSRGREITVSDLGMVFEHLSALEYSLDRLRRR